MEKYSKKGYTGLVNLGNTCFLNSCIQALNHTYELSEYLSSDKCSKHTKTTAVDSTIVREWNDLRKVMWDSVGAVSPNRFVYYVQQLASAKNRELFTGWAQNDMPEFLLFMIECIHNSVSRSIKMKIMGSIENPVDKLATECYKMLQQTYSREYSEIMDLFYGIYVSELLSIDGRTSHTVKAESFFILDLPIPKKEASLYDCFDAFTSPEIMEGDNAWKNEASGKNEDVQKRITFWNFPKILVITLKRFSADGKLKIQDLVDFPIENLNLSKYISGYNPNQYIYDLYAICNHSGSPHGGHYTSYVKNIDNEWIHYNDMNLERNVVPGKILTPKAYCLFYRKKNSLV
jgi:ubiquitin C-terminal hydrolase